MLFLEGSSLDLVTPPGFTLSEVHRDIFQATANKWRLKSHESSESSGSENDDDSTEITIEDCPCSFKALLRITADDIHRYAELLSILAESTDSARSSADGKVDRNKPHRIELEALHSQIMQEQLSVQKQLLSLSACPHVHLDQGCERLIHTCLLHHQGALVNHVLPFYNRSKRTLPIRSSSCQLSCLAGPCGQSAIVQLPTSGRFGSASTSSLSTILDSKNEDSIATLTKGWKGPPVDVPEIIIQDSTLYFLFEDPSSHGMHFPFIVTDCDTDSNPLSRHRVHFFGPIWSRPPDARCRARLYFEWSFRANCFTKSDTSSLNKHVPNDDFPRNYECPGENSGEPTSPNSRRSSIVAASTPSPSSRFSLRSRRNHELSSVSNLNTTAQSSISETVPKMAEPNSSPSSSRRMSLRTRGSKTDSSISKESTIAVSNQSPRKPNSPAASHSRSKFQSSRRQTIIMRSGSNDEPEEEGNLTIDVLDSAGVDLDEHSASSCTATSIAAICSVVPRCQHSTPTNNSSFVSDPMTPIGSTPASPVPEFSAYPNGYNSLSTEIPSASPRVIPLEPVQQTESHATTPNTAKQVISPVDPSHCSRYSWSTLQLADLHVHVYYERTLWSSSSCMSCSKNSGRCLLWPSCTSRQVTSSDTTKSEGEEAVPVFVQMKPEYLGVWGCEVLSSYELAEAWLGSKIRGDANILRIRVLTNTGEIVWVEYQSLQEFLSANPELKPDINVGQLSSLFTQLSKLPVGSYVLSPSADQAIGPFDLYEADGPVSPRSASQDVVGRLDLNSVVRQFTNVSSSVVELTSRMSETGFLHSPWHSVHRLKLDLNLPACLDSSGALIVPSGSDLRLPGLPLDRLKLAPVTPSKLCISPSAATESKPTGKSGSPKCPTNTRRNVRRETASSGPTITPPKRKLRSQR